MMRSGMLAVGLSEKDREKCGVVWGLCFGEGKAERKREGLIIPQASVFSYLIQQLHPP